MNKHGVITGRKFNRKRFPAASAQGGAAITRNAQLGT